MPPEIDYQTCMRYVRRECSPAEAYAVRAWLADPANEQQAQSWMTSYANQVDESEADDIENSFDYTGMRQSLHARLGLTKPAAVPRSHAWQPWAAAAAMVATLAGGGWLWQGQHQPAAVATTSYSTPYGQTRVVQLPDGSTATLNANSKLRYAAAADAETPREVWLEGEAYFSVKHLPDNKHFVVHTTAGFNVEVLGTKFTVYRRHERARVVLLSGKVQVAFADTSRRSLVMKPGELVSTSDNSRLVEHRPVQAGSYADWTTNKLVFDATTLAEVAQRLQDTYGVTVVAANPALLKRRFTGVFAMENLDRLCENLTESFHLRIVRQDNRLLLSEQPTSSSKPRH
jgi:transmembrane sensor